MRARSAHMEEEAETNTFIFVIRFLLGVRSHFYNVFTSAGQTGSAIHIHIPPPLDFLPIQITTEHCIEFPGLYVGSLSHFTLSINSIYLSVPTPIPPCMPCPSWCLFVLYISVSISVLVSKIQMILSRFNIYMH